MGAPNHEQIAYMLAHASDDRRPGFIVLNSVFLAIAYLAVVARFLSRRKIGTNIGADDVLICFALLFVTGHVACLFVTVHFGMGRHVVPHVKNVRGFALTALIAQSFYNCCIPAIKLSILALYHRIFHRTSGWFLPALYAVGIFVVSYSIAQTFVYIFQCIPISSLWNPDPNAKCVDFRAAIIIFGTINIITDWIILALPVPVVVGLRMESRTKWSLCGLFLWGGFVCIISIIRIWYAKNVDTVDPSWDYVAISQISSIEGCSGILAACMPTYRPLFRFLGNGIGSLFSSNKGKSSNNSNGRSNPNHELGALKENYSNNKASAAFKAGSKSGKRVSIMHPHMQGSIFKTGRSDTIGSEGSKEEILGSSNTGNKKGNPWTGQYSGRDSPDPEMGVVAQARSERRTNRDTSRERERDWNGGIVITRTITTVSGERVAP